MFAILLSFLRSSRACFQSRADLQMEILALRHQIVVLQRRTPKPKLKPADRRFWVGLSQFWPRWRSALWIVKPATVIDWHRRGFRWYRTWKIRHGQPGRPPVSKERRELIWALSRDNVGWGAPRIHSELLKLGIKISESSIAKYMVRQPKPPSPRWRTFLKNHAKQLVSVDFFIVPTALFQVLSLDKDSPIRVRCSPSARLLRFPRSAGCITGTNGALPNRSSTTVRSV